MRMNFSTLNEKQKEFKYIVIKLKKRSGEGKMVEKRMIEKRHYFAIIDIKIQARIVRAFKNHCWGTGHFHGLKVPPHRTFIHKKRGKYAFMMERNCFNQVIK